LLHLWPGSMETCNMYESNMLKVIFNQFVERNN
jgi:hypothetical protein